MLVRRGILKRAESLIKAKARKFEWPAPLETVRTLFAELPQTSEPPCAEFLDAIFEGLRIEPNGSYISRYSDFLNGLPPLGNPPRDKGAALRVLWWVLRGLDVRFVRLDPFEMQRDLLNRCAREEFLSRCRLAAKDLPELDDWVDQSITGWLLLNGLTGPGWPQDFEEQRTLAGDFLERRQSTEVAFPQTLPQPDNQALTEEIKTLREQAATLPDLQQRLQRLDEEKAALRQERDQLRQEQKLLQEQATQSRETVPPTWVASEFRELRALLTLLDEKYPLESLNRLVSTGVEPDPPVTLRQFVSHLFLGLRKRGLAPYPDQEEFDLGYNDSGLYDCIGFEMAPGETQRVVVRTRGWALKSGRSLIPIRRARVQRVANEGSETKGRGQP